MSFRSYSTISDNETNEDIVFFPLNRPIIKYDLFGSYYQVKIPYPWKLVATNFVQHKYTKEILKITDELFIGEGINGKYRKNILKNTIVKQDTNEYALEYERNLLS